MPKRTLFKMNRYNSDPYFGVKEEAKKEVDQKREALRDHYAESELPIEKLYALYQMRARGSAFNELNNPDHVLDEIPGWRDAIPEFNRENGYRHYGTSSREASLIDSAEDHYAENYVSDFEGLKQLYRNRGILLAELRAEMAQERRQFLARFPENDPDRERKADYLVRSSGGAYKKHEDLRETTQNIENLIYNANRAYEDFCEAYERDTKRSPAEASLQEIGAYLNVAAEDLPAFYASFQVPGADPVRETETIAQIAAKTGKKKEDMFYDALDLAMEREGIRLGRSLMPEEQQKLVDEGSRYHLVKDYRGLKKGNEQFNAWVQREGRPLANRIKLEHLNATIRNMDKEIIKKTERVAPFGNNVRLSKISELPQEMACSLAYSKRKNLEKQIMQEQAPERRKKLAAEYLVSKVVGQKLDAGESCEDYPKARLQMIAASIRKNVVEKLSPEVLAGDQLMTALNEESRMEKAEQLEEAVANRYQVSYDKYMTLHTGKNKGTTPEEMTDNLAKNLAAYSLKKLNKGFDLKLLHKTANYLKELYSLDLLRNDPDQLRKSLETPEAAVKAGALLRDRVYGVPEENRGAFAAAMRKLSQNMVNPSGHSKEYKALCESVRRAGELESTTAGMSAEKKAEAYRQANVDVMEAAFRYTKGKEKVRRTQEGNACFSNALDAVSVVEKHAPLTNIRAQKWIDGINAVRNPEQRIDGANLQGKYGAERAAEHPFKPRTAVQPQPNQTEGPQIG